eukprot:TRINITY_DN12839_c0_g1_i5.p1 TRINITY_DN12839_c0_g1~~TRINITY_DN12839_c0_g1_i5.p1  ORF type:complete len:359 (+),score=121.01 TRINITY_DN12839_c0_g1_i5:19-1095(+)
MESRPPPTSSPPPRASSAEGLPLQYLTHTHTPSGPIHTSAMGVQSSKPEAAQGENDDACMKDVANEATTAEAEPKASSEKAEAAASADETMGEVKPTEELLPAVQRWGPDAPYRKVTYGTLKERFGEHFMPDDELDKAIRAIGLSYKPDVPEEASEEAPQSPAAPAAVEPALQPVPTESPEELWAAELPEDEEETPTDTLRIQGMTLPFSRVLLRKFLEKPAKFNEPLEDGKTYRVASDTVFVTYPSVDTARRQRRRVDGMQWPRTEAGGLLRVTYVNAEDVETHIEQQRARAEEQEASLRRKVEEELTKNARPTLSDLFSRTTSTPRLYYSFEKNEQSIARARKQAERRVEQLIASG